MTVASEIRGFASVIPISDPANVPLARQKTLLYGMPKIGKTTLASQYPNPLVLDAEYGTLNLAVPTWDSLIGKDRVNNPIRKWEEVLQATSVIEALENVEGTLVIDTANEVFGWCRDYVLRTNGWDHETDGAYGKGWRAVRDEFSSWCRRLTGLPYGLIFVAHENTIEIESATEKYEKVVPRMDKACKEIIEPMVDLIMYAHSRTFPEHGIHSPIQCVQTKPTKQVTSGERGNNPRLPVYVSPMTYEALDAAWTGKNTQAQEDPAS